VNARTRYREPPLWEIGLSAETATPDLFDPYEIRELHELFRDRLPRHEMAPTPAEPIDPQNLYGQGQIPGFIQFTEVPPTRWWFLSEDAHTLAQFQPNFLARNWRRVNFPPDSAPAYPGFEELKTQFETQVAAVREWSINKGRPLPDPKSCEILYDNFIIMPALGVSGRPPHRVFSPLSNLEPRERIGLAINWSEKIKDTTGSDAGVMRITSNYLGLPSSEGGLTPIFRLLFVARASVKSWLEVSTFFDTAHALIGERFVELITPECRATWGIS
jgi:uncharacterized protein (TIGR04255 family)